MQRNFAGCCIHGAASGLRVPYRVGNANNAGNAGLEYLNANNGVTNANANVGSPLNLLRSVQFAHWMIWIQDLSPWRKMKVSKV